MNNTKEYSIEKRNQLHREIQDLKEKRDSLNKIIKEDMDKLNLLKGNVYKNELENISNLKRILNKLEKTQMTSVLTVKEEKKIIKDISNVNKKIKDLQNKILSNKEIEILSEDLKNLRLEVKGYHNKIIELSKEANEHHEKTGGIL